MSLKRWLSWERKVQRPSTVAYETRGQEGSPWTREESHVMGLWEGDDTLTVNVMTNG
jgi:hypothetical protein